MVKMWNKKKGWVVDVYQFFENGMAMTWSDECAHFQKYSTGWEIVKASSLVPIDFYETHKDKYVSDSERKQLKSKLTFVAGAPDTWIATDGTAFKECGLAIKHEKMLADGMKGEKNA